MGENALGLRPGRLDPFGRHLVQAMGMSGISKSQVSRLSGEIDDKVKAFLNRPIEGDWPYLWIDATYVKVRQNGQSRRQHHGGSNVMRVTTGAPLTG
jgi:hypothetical protein